MDSADYTPATDSVPLQVNPATPTITWTTPAAIIYGTALSTTQLNATANVPGTFVYSPAAGMLLGVGSQTLSVTFIPNDSIDYTTATATIKLGVIYQPSGTCDGDFGHVILQPINADGTSVWHQGRTIPAKFRICNASGVSIGTTGVVTSFNLTGMINGTVSNVDETVSSTTPDSVFRWDPTGQQWIFNISTATLPAGQTYVYTIALNDGSIIMFQFGLK
jgi:hypothetical protein